MSRVHITRRPIKRSEADLLIQDIRSYPDLIFVKRSRFLSYSKAYIIEVNGMFAGICGVYEIGGWVKLGPFVLLQKFHGMGYGSLLLTKVVRDFQSKNIFITSSNIVVQKIARKLKFKEVKGYLHLPFSIQLFLISHIYEHISLEMVREFIRKKFIMKTHVREYFIKNKYTGTKSVIF